MRRIAVLTVLVPAMLCMFVAPAFASSPHFKHGGQPTCTITSSGSSASVVCTGSITGLGNADVLIKTTVSGFAVYQCQNGGGNLAPDRTGFSRGRRRPPP